MQLSLMLGGRGTEVEIDTVVVAGFAGRDRAAVEHHVAELEALGVSRPSRVPVFYRVSASRLTTASTIESTAASSGEVEAILLRHGGKLWVGVGSDHTDRDVERTSVAVAKQMCDKPVGCELWPYEDVAAHWDQLRLRAWATIGGEEVLYQDGALAALLPAPDLLALSTPPVGEGTLLFGGTVPALGGIRPAQAFRYELADPVRGRALRGAYEVRTLPLVR